MGVIALGLYLYLGFGHRFSVAGTIAILAVGLGARPYARRYLDVSARWFRGAHAEESVGAALAELRREGWILMHDVPQAFEGNIDHIASGPNGVFMIETKESRYDDGAPHKAKRQAAKLHDELDVWVTPVICLYRRRGRPFRTKDGVQVVPLQHLLGWLRDQREKPVEFERLARYADRIN